jgi:hypothetical protein
VLTISSALLNENHVKSLLNHIDLTPYLVGPACIIVEKSELLYLKNKLKKKAYRAYMV